MAKPSVVVEILKLDEVVVVKLVGELHLDVEGVGTEIDRGVIVHKPKVVVVDCSALTFISSIGMSLLVNLSNAAKRWGGEVKLAALNPMVEGALRHAGLNRLFRFYGSVGEASGPAIL